MPNFAVFLGYNDKNGHYTNYGNNNVMAKNWLDAVAVANKKIRVGEGSTLISVNVVKLNV